MELAFEILPNAEELKDLSNVKALQGYPNRDPDFSVMMKS